jgi:hypothetical protein
MTKSKYGEGQSPGPGMTRRVFVGRSVTAAGGLMVLANARAFPAWAGEAEEGTIERMGRIAFDPEANKTWVSLLHVEVSTREIQTEFGPTRVSEGVSGPGPGRSTPARECRTPNSIRASRRGEEKWE